MIFIFVYFAVSPIAHIQRSDAPLITRDRDDAYTYGEDYNISFTAASSHL